MQRPGLAPFEWFQHALDARFVDLVGDPLKVEVLEPRVGENLRQFDFLEQRQFDRELRILARRGAAAEARHQAGGFLAATHRVDVLDEVQALATEIGFQFAVLTGREGRNQVGLAGLGQAEKANGHRRAGHATEAVGQVAGAVQADVQVVGFAVQPWCVAACLANPFQRLTGTFINSGPTG